MHDYFLAQGGGLDRIAVRQRREDVAGNLIGEADRRIVSRQLAARRHR